ncbi:hypothetical protein HDU96_001538 [Phlyctochytrium bullatum]|nr:hypothetical protein HDU96_001538 [Phlyctochytrium bullatum]
MPDDVTKEPTKFVLIDVGGAFAFKIGDRLCKGTEVHWTWNYGSLDMHRDAKVGTALATFAIDSQADIPVHPHVALSQNARPSDDMWSLFYTLTVLSQCALPWMRPEQIGADEVYNRKRQFSAFPERFIGAEHKELLDFHKHLTSLERGELNDCQYDTFEELLKSMLKRVEREQPGAPPVRASNAGRRKPVATISNLTSITKSGVEASSPPAVTTGPCKNACVETSNTGRDQQPAGTMTGKGEQTGILPEKQSAEGSTNRKPATTPDLDAKLISTPKSGIESSDAPVVTTGPCKNAAENSNTVCEQKPAGTPNRNCKQAGILPDKRSSESSIDQKPTTVADLGQIKLILEQIVDRVSGTSTPTYADSEASEVASGTFDSSDQHEPMADIDHMKKLLEEILDRVRVGQAVSAASGDKSLVSEHANLKSSFDSRSTAISMADTEPLSDKAPQQAVSTAESRPSGSPPVAKKNGLRWLQALGRKWKSPEARGDDVPIQTAEASSVDRETNATESNMPKKWIKNFCDRVTAWCRKGPASTSIAV